MQMEQPGSHAEIPQGQSPEAGVPRPSEAHDHHVMSSTSQMRSDCSSTATSILVPIRAVHNKAFEPFKESFLWDDYIDVW